MICVWYKQFFYHSFESKYSVLYVLLSCPVHVSRAERLLCSCFALELESRLRHFRSAQYCRYAGEFIYSFVEILLYTNYLINQ